MSDERRQPVKPRESKGAASRLNLGPDKRLANSMVGLDVEDLTSKFAAFAVWNGEMARFMPWHLAEMKILQLHDRKGTEPVSLESMSEIIKILAEIHKGRPAPANPLEPVEFGPGSDEAGSGLTLMREASSMILSPGFAGETLGYTLARFHPFDSTLQREFGFAAKDACRFVRWMVDRGENAVRPFSLEIPRRMHPGESPHKYSSEMAIPSIRFCERLREAASLRRETLEHLSEIDLNPLVPKFLSADSRKLSELTPSLSRWAFLECRGGGLLLLLPSTMIDTLLTALNLGLLEVLKDPDLGSFGKEMGEAFEDYVSGRVRLNWPRVTQVRRVQRDKNTTDADLLLTLPDGSLVTIQCKGHQLAPRGRWVDVSSFREELERTVLAAARQSKRFLDSVKQPERIGANFIVLEAYFPWLPYQHVVPGFLGRALAGLRRPLVIDHFDFDYLLEKIKPQDLIRYLDWREWVLRAQAIIPHDEFDLIRAYLQRSEIRPDIAVERGARVFMIGADDEKARRTWRETDRRLDYRRNLPLLLGTRKGESRWSPPRRELIEHNDSLDGQDSQAESQVLDPEGGLDFRLILYMLMRQGTPRIYEYLSETRRLGFLVKDCILCGQPWNPGEPCMFTVLIPGPDLWEPSGTDGGSVFDAQSEALVLYLCGQHSRDRETSRQVERVVHSPEFDGREIPFLSVRARIEGLAGAHFLCTELMQRAFHTGPGAFAFLVYEFVRVTELQGNPPNASTMKKPIRSLWLGCAVCERNDPEEDVYIFIPHRGDRGALDQLFVYTLCSDHAAMAAIARGAVEGAIVGASASRPHTLTENSMIDMDFDAKQSRSRRA